MPRAARIPFAGHPLHVVHRGVNRGACFADDADRAFYLGLLQEFVARSDCALHAYVLMSNHVHLLFTPADDGGAARLMKAVAQRHTQRCNKRWGRTGPLWEGRYKSSLVDSHGYALNCHRYIEENPVRAGMVRHPAEYAWSSFRANGMGIPCPFLTEHPSRRSLGEDDIERRIAYRTMFDAPQPEKEVQLFRAALASSLPAGSENFIKHVAIASGRRMKRRNRVRPSA
jgi:putative transposase